MTVRRPVHVTAIGLLLSSFLPIADAGAKTLVFCSEGAPEALSPQIVTTTTGMDAAHPIFNTLVATRPGGTDIVPELAERWTISADGLVYTFHLRNDVAFHANATFTPTRRLTADDVRFSLERQLRSDHPFHEVSGGDYAYFEDASMESVLQAVEAVDAHTVRITLTRPEASFLANLALPLGAVQSAEYAEQLLREGKPELIDLEPIGTGPFTFDDYQKDVAIRYRAFDGYWNGRPKIDTLVYSITPNPGVRMTKLKAGECSVMAFPDPGDVDAIASDPNLKLFRQEGFNVGYLAMNTTKPPFDDVRVRRAINLAVDKRAIIDAVYHGAGVAAINPLPPASWAYNDKVQDYPHDPEAAWQLLVEAGHAGGFETDLWYMPVSRPYNPNGKRVAEMIATDLARVGIRARLVTREWGAYRTSLQQGEHEMALYGWTGDNADPSNFLQILLGCASANIDGNNVARWCDPDYDALVTEAGGTTDTDKRAELYRQAQEIAKRQAPWMPIAHSVVFMATRNDVSGFVIAPLSRNFFDRMDIVETN